MREKVRRMSIDEFCREAAEGSGSMREKVRRVSINEFCREAAEESASMQGGCEMWNFKLPCFGIEYII